MPPVARLFVRTSLLMLVAGIGIGAIGLAEPSWLTRERSITHAHLLLVGWLLNFVLGVAWWMFPRIAGTVAHWAWPTAGWAMLNAGLVLRSAVDLFAGGMIGAPAPVRWASALLQVAGIAVMAALLWRRARGPSNRSTRAAAS